MADTYIVSHDRTQDVHIAAQTVIHLLEENFTRLDDVVLAVIPASNMVEHNVRYETDEVQGWKAQHPYQSAGQQDGETVEAHKSSAWKERSTAACHDIITVRDTLPT